MERQWPGNGPENQVSPGNGVYQSPPMSHRGIDPVPTIHRLDPSA
jgi:hypothetical protein